MLLAYGVIFASNVVQTDVSIDERLSEALDRAPIPAGNEDEMQSWLARNACIIVVEVTGNAGAGTYSFNTDDLSEKELNGIVAMLDDIEDENADFEIDGRYFRAHRQITLGNAERESVTVYSVYDWTDDRADLINSGVTTAVIYLLCLVLLYIFGQLVSRQIIAPVKQSYEQQKQLVADASHELKTPLAIIGEHVFDQVRPRRDRCGKRALD